MKRFLALPLLLLSACSKSGSADTTPAADTPATVTISSQQTLSGYPHTIDYYIPSNATAAMVLLHGGGGKKEGFAYNLGLKTTSDNTSYALTTSGESWLKTHRVAVIFAQGQNLAPLAWTWNNYVMDSGEDDVAFLQALAASIRTDARMKSVTKLYLAGPTTNFRPPAT